MKFKGNVLVGQSGGPTAAINASLAGVFTAATALGADKIYGMKYGIEGFLKEKTVDLKKVLASELDVELLKRTPSSYLGSCRFKLPEATEDETVYRHLFSLFEKYGICAFFYIGGNDSMDTVKKLSAYAEKINSDVRFIGVPKTIDNDLCLTDHTPGYGSAAKFVATAVKELVRDSLVYDMKSVTVVEIMGRDAGWLTAAAALAAGEDGSGPALILLPEVPFDYEYVKERVRALTEERGSIVIALSEGIRTADGRYVCEMGKSAAKDVFGHTQLSNAGQTVAQMLKEDLHIKSRAVELSTLQRCACHTASLTDINEAFAAGVTAAEAARKGESGKMVLLKRKSTEPYICETDLADVAEIANLEKCVPKSMINETGDYVTDEFIRYARPLIKGEASNIYVGGLCAHIPPLDTRS